MAVGIRRLNRSSIMKLDGDGLNSSFTLYNSPQIGRRESHCDSVSSRNKRINKSSELFDVPQNDDEAERRERQRNKMVELQQMSPQAPVESRKSLGVIGTMNSRQLAEHYSNCIKLSAENKINMKNAFSLQLIDYMAMMLKKKDSDMNNFQVASCTLDASTKIYAYRVDCVHTDTMKMAGGLGRAVVVEENKKAGESGVNDDPDPEDDADIDPERRFRRKKRVKKSMTVEQNIKNINRNKSNVELQVDPLFKKLAISESSAGGCTFLTSLKIMDNRMEVLLHSDVPWPVSEDQDAHSQQEPECVSIARLQELNNHAIDPVFSAFSFRNWSVDDEPVDDNVDRLEKLQKDTEHAFDMMAVPDEDHFQDLPEDNIGADVFGDEEEDHIERTVAIGCHSAENNKTVDMRKFLAVVPQEYSYFEKCALSAWAGPKHWKIRPFSKESVSVKDATKKQQKKTITLEFEEGEDFCGIFRISKKSTKLVSKTMKQWDEGKITHPADIHYTSQDLLRCFLRKKISVQPQSYAQEVDESVHQYNYNNDYDQENYCPNVQDHDEDSVGMVEQDLSSRDVHSFPVSTQEAQNEDGTGFCWDDLVVPPSKVPRIFIPYAQTAKKIDMKKLKCCIWEILTEGNSNKENAIEETPSSRKSRGPQDIGMTKEITFTHLYKELPPRLSSKMAENLSVPLAFIALLHLANEKTLRIQGQEDMLDLLIGQG